MADLQEFNEELRKKNVGGYGRPSRAQFLRAAVVEWHKLVI
jgi:hypothetical protein